jgi:hypothetical protein
MPYGDTTTPSCEDETLPVRMIFDKHDCLWVMCEREDVLGQLHTVVTGVERTADASSCRVDRYPPCKAVKEPMWCAIV